MIQYRVKNFRHEHKLLMPILFYDMFLKLSPLKLDSYLAYLGQLRYLITFFYYRNVGIFKILI